MDYTYSVDNRMVSALTSVNNKDIEVLFSYDALGRRTDRTENIYQCNNHRLQKTTTDYYFYSGTSMQMSSRSYQHKNNPNRSLTQDYFYGVGGLTSFTGERDTYYAFSDYQGSMTAFVDRHSLKDDYLYDAFGSLVLGSFDADNVLGYNGKAFDETTKLFNYGYRDYAPAHASFTYDR